VLTLTDSAKDVLRELMESIDGVPDDAGVRISVDADTEGVGELAFALVAAPDDGDVVVDADGTRVFIDGLAAQMLGDKILDAERNGDQFLFSISDGPPAFDAQMDGHPPNRPYR
jgi:iron-sulfur cluster assembly protein